jgi:hypothetical protein
MRNVVPLFAYGICCAVAEVDFRFEPVQEGFQSCYVVVVFVCDEKVNLLPCEGINVYTLLNGFQRDAHIDKYDMLAVFDEVAVARTAR